MYVDLVQYPHLVAIVVASLDAIPSSIVPDHALQKVLPLIQNESGNAIEENEWPHKGSR
jgi:hypothetical protein